MVLMIEQYSSNVTEIEELGGATNAAISSMVVCDRCGFGYPRTKLTDIDGHSLCSKCIDRDREE